VLGLRRESLSRGHREAIWASRQCMPAGWQSATSSKLRRSSLGPINCRVPQDCICEKRFFSHPARARAERRDALTPSLSYAHVAMRTSQTPDHSAAIRASACFTWPGLTGSGGGYPPLRQTMGEGKRLADVSSSWNFPRFSANWAADE
jgi:hypothetical protein